MPAETQEMKDFIKLMKKQPETSTFTFRNINTPMPASAPPKKKRNIESAKSIRSNCSSRAPSVNSRYCVDIETGETISLD